MGSNFAFNWSFSLRLHILHCHLSHVHIFPKRGFFFVGRFKDLALDLIVREKMKQIRFTQRADTCDWLKKVTNPIKFFSGVRQTLTQMGTFVSILYYNTYYISWILCASQSNDVVICDHFDQSAACLATCLSSFSWGRSGQSLPLQQETTFSNLISKNFLGKSEQKWYQYEGRGWFLWVFAWLGDCAFPIKRCNVTSKPTASVTLLLMFLPQH